MHRQISRWNGKSGPIGRKSCRRKAGSLPLGAAALASLGERERAKEWLARALTMDLDDNLTRYNAACTYSPLGELDRAIDLLENWLPQVSSDMKLWFSKDSDLDAIRGHPRYQRLLELAS